MNYELERSEARQAGQKALRSLNRAYDELRKARNWGFYDILGGGFLSSLIKHGKIDNAREYIQMAKRDLQTFSRELSDIRMYIDIDIDNFLTFFDFMDNFFADFMVQRQINDAQSRIKEAIYRVEDALRRI